MTYRPSLILDEVLRLWTTSYTTRKKGWPNILNSSCLNFGLSMKEKKLWLFFALSKDALVLNSQDRNIIEKDKNKSSALPAKEENVFWEQEKYPAIEIDYLAVREDKRTENNCNLGSAIIESIAQIAANDNLTSTLFLTVEALHTDYYSTIGFYKKCNFAYSEKDMDNYEYNKRYGTTFTTRRMYKIIIPNN